MSNIIGSCSICGGDVASPAIWAGIIPPTATCTRCGATSKNLGPVIPMRPVSEGKAWTGTSTVHSEYRNAPAIGFPTGEDA